MQPNMRMLQQMQNRIVKMQEELGETIVEGTAGGGMVTARPGDTGTTVPADGVSPKGQRASSPTPEMKYHVSWIHRLNVALLVVAPGSSQ